MKIKISLNFFCFSKKNAADNTEHFGGWHRDNELMAGTIYDKSTRELFKDFIDSFVPPPAKDGFDEFLDAFIEDAIEANGCYCEGGGKEDKLDVIVELGRRSDDPDARLNRITAWLDVRPDVEHVKLGEEFDIWNENYKDINEY